MSNQLAAPGVAPGAAGGCGGSRSVPPPVSGTYGHGCGRDAFCGWRLRITLWPVEPPDHPSPDPPAGVAQGFPWISNRSALGPSHWPLYERRRDPQIRSDCEFVQTRFDRPHGRLSHLRSVTQAGGSQRPFRPPRSLRGVRLPRKPRRLGALGRCPDRALRSSRNQDPASGKRAASERFRSGEPAGWFDR